MICQGTKGCLLLLAWMVIHAIGQHVWAQTDSTSDSLNQKAIFSVGLGLHHGFIFAHSPAVENTKGANPTGVELSFAWQRNNADSWNLCRCFPRNGFLIAYYDYDTDILGKSITAAYFLEPTYQIGKRTHFSLRAVAGLSYLTSPYDEVDNPTNRSYSTYISGYILLGLGIWFKIDNNWWLNLSANYQHESNGGLKEPNKGINWPTAGLALSYQKNPRTYYTGTRKKEKYWKELGIRWDAALFGVAKRVLDTTGESIRLPLVGLNLQGSKQVSSINALTAGVEVFYDEALSFKLKQDSLDASAWRAGILIGHEFLLGKFNFSQRIGVYVFKQADYFDALFHRWGIQYSINRHWGVGVNLQAHRQVADFIDLRVIYSWRAK